MYDPALRTRLLEKLVRWESLPEGDLLTMLGAVDRLRYRPEALQDLVFEGLVCITMSGDEPMVRITEAGRERLRERR